MKALSKRSISIACIVYSLTAILMLAGCTEVISLNPPETKTIYPDYPLWFSIKNKSDKPLEVRLIMGTVPKHTASYADFTKIPEEYLNLVPLPDNWTTKTMETIVKGAHKNVAMLLDLKLFAYTEPYTAEVLKYRNFMLNKLITFVLEISDGTDTVRAAGWELPTSEWTANNIAAAGWGVWNTGEWGSAGHMSQEEKARVRPRLYISWDGTRWVHYPDSTTTAYFIEFGSPDAKQKINLNWVETYSPTYDLEEEADLTWRIDDETEGGSAQNT